ncbi:MAG: hypothetical protein ACXVIF_03745 [Halobacteriota archaeon]
MDILGLFVSTFYIVIGVAGGAIAFFASQSHGSRAVDAHTALALVSKKGRWTMLFAVIAGITLQNWGDIITDAISFVASGAFALGAILGIIAIFG